jgi:HSP20 family protein
MERLFQEAWLTTRSAGRRLITWQPPLDMYEAEDKYVVRLELAGAHEDEIDIGLFADRLVISGRRAPAHTHETTQVAYHMAGIMYGDFQVALRLPSGIAHDAVTATYEEGFLTITLPKKRMAVSISADQGSVLAPDEALESPAD